MATDLLKSYDKVAVPIKPQERQDLPPMQAVSWWGARDMRVTETPRPAITHPKDVVLRVTSTAICGSDLHLYVGAFPRAAMQKGDVLGHEFMGVVEEVGDQVHKLKVGQRVVASFDISCGSCPSCERQLYTLCDRTNPSDAMDTLYNDRTAGLFGYSHLTGGWAGGQAEYVRVPFAEQNVLVVDGAKEAKEGLGDLDVLLLSDVLATAWHANEMGEVGRGDVVAIWGAGPVGLLSAHCAMHRGAAKIILIDQEQYRLDMLEQKLRAPGYTGDIHTINFRSLPAGVTSVPAALRSLVPSGPDVCIEAVGFHYARSLLHKAEMALMLETDPADVINEILLSCRKGGRVSVVGVYLGYMNHVNFGALMEKGLTLKAGQTPVQRYWHTLLDKIKSGALQPRAVVTHELPLSEAPRGYRLFNDKDDHCVKVVLHPPSYYHQEEQQQEGRGAAASHATTG